MAPTVRAGLEHRHRRGRRSFFTLQETTQKRDEHILAKVLCRVFVESQRTEAAAAGPVLSMVPRACGEEVPVVVPVMGFEGRIGRRRTIDVLLVPVAVDVKSWNQAFRCIEPLVSGTVSPELRERDPTG